MDNLNSMIRHLRNAIDKVNSRLNEALPIPEIHPSLLSDLGTPVPLHVSLSRTLQIKTDDRESFLATLTSSLKRAAVRPFDVRFSGLKWVPNYQRNRWFLVLGIEKPAHDELNRLLDACNDAAEKCGHQPLYVGGKGDGPMENHSSDDTATQRRATRKAAQPDDAAKTAKPNIDRTQNYHVSIAWNLMEPDPKWIDLAQSVDVSKFIVTPQVSFESVKAKIGNVVHNIEVDPRKAKVGRGSGLLGLG